MNHIFSPSWQSVLEGEPHKEYYQKLMNSVSLSYNQNICFPEERNIFRAFDITAFDDIKVVILGQDPYHTAGAAMGLSFSVPNGSKMQPSLRNIFKELESDVGVRRENTDLIDWAEQGVLLLNSVLTVRSSESASHAGLGWETFTDTVIRLISEKQQGIIFVLWGNYAISKVPLIDIGKHYIVSSPHPSPFSAYRGFFGSAPFSQINSFLTQQGKKEIFWG